MSAISLKNSRIGFIGGGNMAKAIAIPLIKKDLIKSQNVMVSATKSETLNYWQSIDFENPVKVTTNNLDVIIHSEILFLAIKPQLLSVALASCRTNYKEEHLSKKIIISVLAGVTLERLNKEIINSILGNDHSEKLELKIFRTIPNLALSIEEGITAYCRTDKTNLDDASLINEIFSPLGQVDEVSESLMNAAGGLAGCGPAFGYLMIEALADGGVKQGLSRALALKFAAQVMVSAGKMVLKTNQHPAVLKDQVCSPGGTTIAGVHALEKGSFRSTLMDAIQAAVERAKELA